MSDEFTDRPRSMTGSGGEPLSLDTLPPPNTKRWVSRRKAEVVAAVRGGVLTLDEACARYDISIEEFMSWQSLIESHGVRGLRVTRLQHYRQNRALGGYAEGH